MGGGGGGVQAQSRIHRGNFLWAPKSDLYTLDEARKAIAAQQTTVQTPATMQPAVPRSDTPGKATGVPAFVSQFMQSKYRKAGVAIAQPGNTQLSGVSLLGQ